MDARQADALRTIDPAQLGQRIRAARLAKGLTQGEITGGEVSVAYVSRIETGHRRPNGRLLAEIAGRLGTSPEQLLHGVAPRELDEIRLTLDYAELSLESGQAQEAEAKAREGMERATSASLEDMADRGRFLHARALEALGELDDAIIELESLGSRPISGVIRAQVGIALSRCYRESGDLTKAIETGERVLAGLEECGLESSDEAVQMAVTLAAAHYERGDTRHAMRVCRRAITLAERCDSPTARASAYWNASVMESDRGAYAEASQLAERALALLGEGEDGRNLARLRTQLGAIQLYLDPPQLPEARRNLEQAARELAWSSAGPVDVARNQLALAHSMYLAGDVREAQSISIEVHNDVLAQTPIIAADAKTLEGQTYAACGDADGAIRAYRQAVHILTGVGADRSAAQLWFELAGLLEDAGELEAARDAYKRAAGSSGLSSRTMARMGATV